jgi:dTDP-4-amino-4,6-dideoxygalactose transaminase
MKEKREISFNKPYVPQNALRLIEQALNSQVQQGDGHFSQEVTRLIESRYFGYRALLVQSCTSAIDLALTLLNLQENDEVIMPSYNFTSAAAVVAKQRATPVFIDIDFRTGCIDVSQIEEVVSSKTRAIIWVNYAGLGVDFEYLYSIAKKYNISLIEDAAHNFMIPATNQKRFVADFIVFSFHASKNIQCGEGGALLIKSPELFERAQVIREKGTNRTKFNSGQVDKYRWIDVGGSYLLAEINAALLAAQLGVFQEIQETRTKIIGMYEALFEKSEIRDWNYLRSTAVASHMFALIAPDQNSRDEFIRNMGSKGIFVTTHYEDLATSEGSKRSTSKIFSNSQSLRFSSCIVRLPVYPSLSKDISHVLHVLCDYFSEEKKIRR